MPARRRAGCLLMVACAAAAAQETVGQFRPELDLYINSGPRTRLLFQNLFEETPRTATSRITLGAFFELALRPVFRRNLRNDPDVFRRRYLTFRGGYQNITKIAAGELTRENRLLAELTARHPLKFGIVVVDRNRGDFRFVQDKPFSTRYRNRLWVERDLKFERVAFTPYIYDEVFFDSRYDSWTINRLAAGLQIPAGRRMIWEPYVMRQHDYRGIPRYINGLGLKLNLFF